MSPTNMSNYVINVNLCLKTLYPQNPRMPQGLILWQHFVLLNLHVVHVHPSELSFPSNLFSTLFLLSALSFKLTVPSDFTLPRLKLRIPGQQMIYFFTLYLLCLLALSKTWLSLTIFFIFSSPNCLFSRCLSPQSENDVNILLYLY